MRLAPLTAAAAAALVLVCTFQLEGTPAPQDQPPLSVTDPAVYEAELAKLPEGSPRALKLEKKLRRLRAWQEGNPEAGYPQLFEQMLFERKIPVGQELPGYEAGYKVRELQRATALARASAAPLPWQSRGPGNVAGRARGIIVDPGDPTGLTWYIGTAGGGVWRTADGGATWTSLTDGLPVLPMTAIAMAPSNPDVIYAGTGEAFNNIDTMNGNGIYRSTDRGASWSPLLSTIDDPAFNNISRIVVDPLDADHVFASAVTGRYKLGLNATSNIFESIDGGASWTVSHSIPSSGGGGRIQQLVADPTNFDVIYASVNNQGVLKTVDGGATWNFVNNGLTGDYGRIELAMSPLDEQLLYASVEGYNPGGAQLFVTEDGGANWVRLDEGFGTSYNWLGAQGWYDNTIVCDPIDRDRVYVGGIYLWRIDRTGATTRETYYINASPSHVDNHGLTIVQPSGGGWFLLNTNDGGVGRTSSSYNSGWSAPIAGMVTTQFYGVTKRPGRDQYLGGMQDNSTWSSPVDAGPNDPWTFHIGGDGYEAVWHDHDATRMMGGSQFNGIQRSLDGGLTWSAAVATSGGGQIDKGAGNAPFITKIANSPAAPDRVFAVGPSGVWYSYDFGGVWDLANMVDFASWQASSSFTDVRVSRADPDVVWAGRAIDANRRMHVSTDGGQSFGQTADYGPLQMGTISGLSTHPTDPNTAYVLFSFARMPKVLRTTDMGATWTDLSGFDGTNPSTNGFPDVAVYDLVVFSDDPDRIWVGTEIGLVESLDGGATWAMANNGLPNVGIWQIHEREDEMVVATHGRGVWSVEFPSLLAGRTLPPVVESLEVDIEGGVDLGYLARSDYDSVNFIVDGQRVLQHGARAAGDTDLAGFDLGGPGLHQLDVVAWSGGQAYPGLSREFFVESFFEPVGTYTTDFDVAAQGAQAGDFTGGAFAVAQPAGFPDQGLHSAHPHADGLNVVTMLRYPIRVAQSDALVKFDEIAIIEPGNNGVPFGEQAFWDYVIVEGSLDGVDWRPLSDGWDARAYSEWVSAYNSYDPGVTEPDASLYRQRVLDLHSQFQYLDVVYLRWRLFSDQAVNSWGWAIDNVEIQAPYAVGNPAQPAQLVLAQNHPNPFNPNTTIRFAVPARGVGELAVFDLRGRQVRSLRSGVFEAGTHDVRWDGTDDLGAPVASGVYHYRLRVGDQLLQRRMTLLK